jgi:hypothetical protein
MHLPVANVLLGQVGVLALTLKVAMMVEVQTSQVVAAGACYLG